MSRSRSWLRSNEVLSTDIRRRPKATLFVFGLFLCTGGMAQQQLQINGNLSFDGQYYNDDEEINAVAPQEAFGYNSWGNVIASYGDFRAGVRFESYGPSLLGYPAGSAYQGSGIGYRYANYRKNDLDVTIGNFYEQFGNGMIFRSYEERYLGVDNAMDGILLKYKPIKGVYLKGMVGRQRLRFDDKAITGVGLVRGLDLEISLNELCDSVTRKYNVILGGSFVSKYEADNDPFLDLPQNVGAFAGRINITSAKWNFVSEYVQKINDPNGSNGNIYKEGRGLLVNATYSVRGLGVSVGAHSFDNMVFQSSRGAGPFDLNINFLPPLSKQHTYNLPATLYPYATQPNGEVAYQAEVFKKFKKGSTLGGKYGTKVSVNYSTSFSLDTVRLIDDTVRLRGYETNFFQMGDQQYFSDLNIEVRKKFSKKFDLAIIYFNLVYDIDVIQGKPGKSVIYADMVVLDGLYRFSNKTSLRMELQHLSTKQDLGNWATVLAELTFSPHWFIAALDQYNYGGSVDVKEIHYPFASAGYIRGGNRFALSYGRQREGIFCVGGVCRNVPAANGLTVSVTSTF